MPQSKAFGSLKTHRDLGYVLKLYLNQQQSDNVCQRMSLLLVLFQIKELKRTLHSQAEGVLTLAGHCQQLYAAHMQLIDLMPDSPPRPTNSCEESPTDTTGNVRMYVIRIIHLSVPE